MTERSKGGPGNFFASRPGLVLIAFVAIAGYFLWTEHRAHLAGVVSWLPWLLLLACPLLHLFMHGGHGGHGDHGSKEGDQ
ncbi:MAG: DUF2933 domain-containing protein [Phycisphaerales bacterium]|nr:DUF2933 domain-containing protein [Phycisphaerales bacterium]